MKKNLAVLSIVVRSSIYKVMLILLGMSLLQIGIFYKTLTHYEKNRDVFGAYIISPWSPEELMEYSYILSLFLGAFLLVCLVLLWAFSERKGTNTEYLYKRLSVKLHTRFLLWTGYVLFCIGLLYMVQIGVVFVMGQLFAQISSAEFVSPQMYFLAFYRSSFLHGLLPMADVMRWVRNVLYILMMSMEIASFGCVPRKPFSLSLILLLFIGTFSLEMGEYGWEIVLILIALIFIVINISRITNNEDYEGPKFPFKI